LKYFGSSFNHLDLTDIFRVCLRRHALPSLLSPTCGSTGSANTWRILWPGSMPQLHSLGTVFLYQLLFDIPQLTQFSRLPPKLKTQDESCLTFSYSNVSVTLLQRFGTKLALGISCRMMDWQLYLWHGSETHHPFFLLPWNT
jgi:hypothetical protein